MATTVPSDPAAEINRYKERLNGLYDLVEEAVKLVDPNSTLIRTSQVQIDEESTGLYSVESLEVSMPSKPGIRLVPKGIYVIGARGRVDARSRLGTQVLVWIEGGGPVLKTTTAEDKNGVQSSSRPLFRGATGGWAWTDNQRALLVPLSVDVFIKQVLPELVA